MKKTKLLLFLIALFIFGELKTRFVDDFSEKKSIHLITSYLGKNDLKGETLVDVSSETRLRSYITRMFQNYFEYAGNFIKNCTLIKEEETKLPVVPLKELDHILDAFIAMKKKVLCDIAKQYVQTVYLSEGTRLVGMGDTHGSGHSIGRNFLRWVYMGYVNNNFKGVENTKYFFTGDIADRGFYGVESWVLVMLFSLINGTDVFVIKGNHEDKNTAWRYGFKKELEIKYGDKADKIFEKFCEVFKLLPSAVYFYDDKDAVQVNHGGSPSNVKMYIVKNENECCSFIQNLYKSFEKKESLFLEIKNSISDGLSWGLFAGKDKEDISFCNLWRGAGDVLRWNEIYNKNYYGANSPIRGFIVGHCHKDVVVRAIKKDTGSENNSFENGKWYSFKDYLVYILMSCPEGLGGYSGSPDHCNSEGFIVVDMKDGYDNWKFQSYNYKLPRGRHKKYVIVDSQSEIGFDWIG